MFETTWVARSKTLGFALETNIDWQRGEFGAIVPARKGWTSPSRIDPGVKDKDSFSAKASWLAAEDHVTLCGFLVRVGVS